MKTRTWLLASTSAFLFTIGLAAGAGCDTVDNAFDCQSVCSKYKSASTTTTTSARAATSVATDPRTTKTFGKPPIRARPASTDVLRGRDV